MARTNNEISVNKGVLDSAANMVKLGIRWMTEKDSLSAGDTEAIRADHSPVEPCREIIFDYSKGYPMPQCVVGFDQEKYERLQDRDLKRKKALEQECKEVEQFVDAIQDSLAHRIFRKLFIDGRKPVTQEQVAKSVHLERSSISKIVDRHLKDSHNSQNAQL